MREFYEGAYYESRAPTGAYMMQLMKVEVPETKAIALQELRSPHVEQTVSNKSQRKHLSKLVQTVLRTYKICFNNYVARNMMRGRNLSYGETFKRPNLTSV